jgi:hypothetical protein
MLIGILVIGNLIFVHWIFRDWFKDLLKVNY